ncbi:hypothetical protein [Spartinivicinus poritis]|uniref:Membrane fusion protein biotin-lipoyl like domain-containing protein n=1 Tax=Spartinivicinus poritis TaxID=2994640 RepID=A0ABT5U609_9GAMM|nr:hypothetical protein [Spartinivicinus sp. A2-2]MDE1461794.1 hypothetical protein [Spartinivicinus sp. A2-2]
MKRIFRKKSLQHAKEKDALELRIPLRYSPFFWPFTITCLLIVFFALSWGFFARLPISIEAKGIIVAQGGVRDVLTSGAGLVKQRYLTKNRQVKAGDVIMELENVEATADFIAKRSEYRVYAEAQNYRKTILKKQLERQINKLNNQISLHESRIAEMIEIEKKFKNIIASYVSEQHLTLKQEQKEVKSLINDHKRIVAGSEKLLQSGLTSLDAVTKRRVARRNLSKNLDELSVKKQYIGVEEQRLNLEQLEVASNIKKEKNEIINIRNQIEKQKEKYQSEVKEIRKSLVKHKLELVNAEQALWLNEHVISPYDGDIIAMNKSPGSYVKSATPVALIGLTPQHSRLLFVHSEKLKQGVIKLEFNGVRRLIKITSEVNSRSYLESQLKKAIKNLFKANKVEITGQENRFVIDIQNRLAKEINQLRIYQAELEDSEGLPVYAMLIPISDGWERSELVNIAFVSTGDAKKIENEAKAFIRPDFIKGLQAGRLKGKITQVSEYNSTSIELEGLIGNLELGKLVADKVKGVAVVVKLDRDKTGLPIWNGIPPKKPLKVGTTTTSRIIIKEIAPIKLLFPIFVEPFV